MDHVIDLYIAQPVDRRLLAGFLGELGYVVRANDPAAGAPAIDATASLVIADAGAARRFGRSLVDLKWRSGPSFLPFLILLPARVNSSPWLQFGYDDVLRLPISKEELKARLEVFLRFRAQSEQYRSMFEGALIGLCRVAPDGRIVIANGAFARILGHADADSLADGVDAATSRISPTFEELARMLVHQERIVGLHSTWRRRDGGVAHTTESVRRVFDESGSLLYFESSLEDVTERKTQEAHMRQIEAERQELYAREQAARVAAEGHLHENVMLASVYHQLASTLETSEMTAAICQAVRDLTGADGAAMILREGDEVIYFDENAVAPLWKGERRPLSESIAGLAIAHREPVIVEDILLDVRPPVAGYRDTFVRSLAVVPVRSVNPVGAITAYWSHEHRATEHQLRVLRALANAADVALANAQLYAEMRAARMEAETASRLKDEFLATVSHELRTPLGAVIGWANILRADLADNPAAAEGLEIIERQGRAQSKIIDDLLDVSRVISGKLHLELDEVDPAGIVAAAVEVVRSSAEIKEVSIETRTSEPLPRLRADAARLQQVVWNLLANAVKFTPTGGRVEVSVDPDAARRNVVITVRDTGDGISAEFLPYVFERFRQGDGRTTRKHGGLGLGLAIVRHLVEMHGGSVAASSDGEGRGSTFSVTLPAATKRSARRVSNGAPTETPLEAVAPAKAALEGIRVLVVDDDTDTRALLCSVLSRSGAEVRNASGVDEALVKLEVARPDILISDIGMPGRDGFDLIREVRSRWGDAMPAVAVTAYARQVDRDRAIAEGFQAHVAKPVDPSELILLVARLASPALSA